MSLVLLFLQSVLRVSVVNSQKGERLALIVGHVAHTTVAHVASRRRTYDRIQDALAWVLPVYVLLLIIVWFALVETDFSLMIWSLGGPSLLRAFIASGSALNTMGFDPARSFRPAACNTEAAFGLGIVVFFFTFIPGYQTTVQTREQRVAWFYARAGPGPTALGLMEWLHRSGGTYDATTVWEDWVSVVPIVDRIHTRAPVVAVIPSVHLGRRRGTGYRILVAFVPRRQGPRLGDPLLQYGGERPEIDAGRRPTLPAAGLPAEPLN